MKRRNAEVGKMRRPMKRNKITEGFYGRYVSAFDCDTITTLTLFDNHSLNAFAHMCFKMAGFPD